MFHSEGKSCFLQAIECDAVTKRANYYKQIVKNKYSCEVKAFSLTLTHLTRRKLAVFDYRELLEFVRNFLFNRSLNSGRP